MRALAFDVGGVRIGLALSDPLGLFAQPKGFVSAGDWDAIQKNIEEWEPEVAVIGHPVGLSGQTTMQTEAVERWVVEFQKRFPDLETVLFDERMTSKVAEAALLESGMSRQKRKTSRDGVAAAVLLQNYLDMKGRG